MENREYFYLDGVNKKGPFTKEEILDMKLENEVLIYHKDLKNWQPFSIVEDFKQADVKEGIQTDKKKKENKVIKIPSFLVFMLLSIVSTAIAFYLSEEHKKKDFAELIEKVEDIFGGKDEICDFKKSGVNGDLRKPKDIPFFEFVINKKDNEGNALYEYFNCISGGWRVYTLKKLNNGYEYLESYSTNMGFKVPESIQQPGTDFGYGLKSPSYSISTYRGTVQNAYNKAMEYISVEKNNNSYVAGSYNKIFTFDELYTDLHHIANIEPTQYSSASENTKAWETLFEASVFNKNWIVWYRNKGRHFEIVFNKESYYKILGRNIAIGIGIALLAFLIWIYSKRIELK